MLSVPQNENAGSTSAQTLSQPRKHLASGCSPSSVLVCHLFYLDNFLLLRIIAIMLMARMKATRRREFANDANVDSPQAFLQSAPRLPFRRLPTRCVGENANQSCDSMSSQLLCITADSTLPSLAQYGVGSLSTPSGCCLITVGTEGSNQAALSPRIARRISSC